MACKALPSQIPASLTSTLCPHIIRPTHTCLQIMLASHPRAFAHTVPYTWNALPSPFSPGKLLLIFQLNCRLFREPCSELLMCNTMQHEAAVSHIFALFGGTMPHSGLFFGKSRTTSVLTHCCTPCTQHSVSTEQVPNKGQVNAGVHSLHSGYWT